MIIPFPYPINLMLVVLLDLFGLYLSFIVYWANKLSKVNKGFSLMVIFILGWVTSYYFAQYGNSIFWFRLFTASVFFFFIAYYFFIVRWFLQKEDWYKIFGWFVLVYGLFSGFLAITTNLIINKSEVIENLFVRPIFHPFGWWLFYGYATVLTIMISCMLAKDYFNYSNNHKIKVLYFLVGFLISAGLNLIFNVALPVFFDNYRFYEIGNYSIFFLLGFIAYAIVKHNLFDIKILLSQILVLVIWTFVLVRAILSSNNQEFFINILLATLVFIAGILLLYSISNERHLTVKLLEETRKSLDLEKRLRERLAKKTGEMIKKMEDIVKE